jgi:hypothetical protein
MYYRDVHGIRLYRVFAETTKKAVMVVCAVIVTQIIAVTQTTAGGPGVNSVVTWTCPGLSECGTYDQMGYPDSIINTGVTEAIVEHTIVGVPYGYNHPGTVAMTNQGTVIATYRSSGPAGGGEGSSAYIYCHRKPADSSWSESILIHSDTVLCEAPNTFQIPGSDTILTWYITDAAFMENNNMQKNYLGAQNYGVRISTDDGATWGDEIILPEIDRATQQISDTAYEWLSNYGHHWPYPDRNSLVMMPNGDLAGFAGTEGDYEGNWAMANWRHMYLRIPRNNLFQQNPDGDAWEAVPVGTEADWGKYGTSITSFLLIFDPSATKLGSLNRGNVIWNSYDGGETWTKLGFANGGEALGKQTGGSLSLDWWDTTSVLNGWHVEAGGSGGKIDGALSGSWAINASDAEQDSMANYHTWERYLSLNHNYGSEWYDAGNGGMEDR